jgi:mRNA degradation ribonuclease J1/J2
VNLSSNVEDTNRDNIVQAGVVEEESLSIQKQSESNVNQATEKETTRDNKVQADEVEEESSFIQKRSESNVNEATEKETNKQPRVVDTSNIMLSQST